MRNIRLSTSPGLAKALLDFSHGDVHWWRDKAASNLKAWGDRVQWFEKTLAAMEEFDAETVADLPNDVLLALDNMAGSIW